MIWDKYPERNNVKPKIFRFIGYSGSGKTTLIEKIVKKLSNDGIKVATIKHDVHGLDIDKPGKDSYRYSEAGAKISVVSSPEIVVYKIHNELSLEEIISNIKDVDIIIIEGYSSDSNYITFSVARKDNIKGIKGNFDNLNGVISDYNKDELLKIGFNGKHFNLNDIDGIISFMLNL